MQIIPVAGSFGLFGISPPVAVEEETADHKCDEHHYSDNNTRHSTLRKITDGLFAIASPQGQWWWWWRCHCNCRMIVFLFNAVWDLICLLNWDFAGLWELVEPRAESKGELEKRGFGVRVTESREEKGMQQHSVKLKRGHRPIFIVRCSVLVAEGGGCK